MTVPRVMNVLTISANSIVIPLNAAKILKFAVKMARVRYRVGKLKTTLVKVPQKAAQRAKIYLFFVAKTRKSFIAEIPIMIVGTAVQVNVKRWILFFVLQNINVLIFQIT